MFINYIYLIFLLIIFIKLIKDIYGTLKIDPDKIDMDNKLVQELNNDYLLVKLATFIVIQLLIFNITYFLFFK